MKTVVGIVELYGEEEGGAFLLIMTRDKSFLIRGAWIVISFDQCITGTDMIEAGHHQLQGQRRRYSVFKYIFA